MRIPRFSAKASDMLVGRAQLRRWGARWGLERLDKSVRVEWSPRLSQSLGRVHVDRRLIRLSTQLAAAPRRIVREVFCHEVAHLAVRDLHGRHCQPHGPEWMALLRAAGFEPRRRIPWSPPPKRSKRRVLQRRQFIHRCPVCHLQRSAWRPVPQWLCADCVAAGLSGRLEILSPSKHPSV